MLPDAQCVEGALSLGTRDEPSDEEAGRIAEACRRVATRAPMSHPRLVGGTAATVELQQQVAEEIAETIMRLLNITSVCTGGESPPPEGGRSRTHWLQRRMSQIADISIANEISATSRGEHYAVHKESMRWGKACEANAARWRDDWRQVADAWASLQGSRGGGTAMEEVAADFNKHGLDPRDGAEQTTGGSFGCLP